MKTLARLCVLALLVTGSAWPAEAQFRAIGGVGVSVPTGNFADETGGGAKAGGGVAFLGAEWLPAGRVFGMRIDGNFNQFCTTFCDNSGGNLDVKWQLLNVNVDGILEMPLGQGARIRPYVLAGLGLYHYKLHGKDVPSAAEDSKTDLGLNGGLGLNFTAGRIGIFAESRFHNVLADVSDIQYVPVTVGVRYGGR